MKEVVEINTEAVAKIYSRYSSFYDLLFEKIFSEGRDASIDLLELKPGDRVLEVGVGTGLTLPLYPPYVQVLGIDISGKMLEKAHEKVDKLGLKNVSLLEMDAQRMSFDDDEFDCVTACYVVSTAPNPMKVVSEIKRVCKRGGRIVFINHFKSKNRLLAKVEDAINGFCKHIGFHTNLELETLLEASELKISRERPVNLFDLWKGVLCINNK